MENKCRICRNLIVDLIIDYKFSYCYTVHSNILIQHFLESVLLDKIDVSEDYVCQGCYNFVNELDELRENLKKGYERLKQIFLGNNTEVQIISNSGENICFTQGGLEGSNIVKEGYSCTICMQVFSCSEELNKHFNKEHNANHTYLEDKSNVSESVISKNINDENVLSQTNISQHSKEIKTSTVNNCNICSKVFKTASKLKKHVASHDVNKSFTCEICGALYKTEKALKVHVGMHNGINPFTCEYCNKSFGQKISLIRHLPIHTGEAPHQCDLCGKRFIHHTSFRFHKMSHTDQKDVKCDVCGLAFRITSHLKRHLKIHTGEKRFSCTECGKQFAEKYNLSVHEKLHRAPKTVTNYECEICHVTFNRKLHLEKHLDKNHQKIVCDEMQTGVNGSRGRNN